MQYITCLFQRLKIIREVPQIQNHKLSYNISQPLWFKSKLIRRTDDKFLLIY